MSRDMHPTHSGLCDPDGCGCPGCDALAELERRHDILDLDDGGGYISINRPKDAPPLTEAEQETFRALADAALKHIGETVGKPCGYSGRGTHGRPCPNCRGFGRVRDSMLLHPVTCGRCYGRCTIPDEEREGDASRAAHSQSVPRP